MPTKAPATTTFIEKASFCNRFSFDDSKMESSKPRIELPKPTDKRVSDSSRLGSVDNSPWDLIPGNVVAKSDSQMPVLSSR